VSLAADLRGHQRGPALQAVAVPLLLSAVITVTPWPLSPAQVAAASAAQTSRTLAAPGTITKYPAEYRLAATSPAARTLAATARTARTVIVADQAPVVAVAAATRLVAAVQAATAAFPAAVVAVVAAAQTAQQAGRAATAHPV
jgi:hypothetical protein